MRWQILASFPGPTQKIGQMGPGNEARPLHVHCLQYKINQSDEYTQAPGRGEATLRFYLIAVAQLLPDKIWE